MKNDDNTQLGLGLAFITMGVIIFFWLIVAFAVFMTVIAVIASIHPLTIGKITIESDNARRFLMRGVAGSIIAPIALFFLTAMFGLRPNWDLIFGYVAGGGYILASIGWEMATYEEPVAPDLSVQFHSPEPDPDRYEELPTRAAQLEMFRFADWDDEEARK